MPSLQTISSRLQKLGSPGSKRLPKSSQTSASRIPFSPRITLLEPIDLATDPLLNASPSKLSATGAHSLLNSPTIFSSVSSAKSESCLPRLPSPSFPLHPNTAGSIGKSKCDRQSEAVPFATVNDAFPHSLGFPAETSTLSGIAVDKDTAPMPGPPNRTERGGRNNPYHESPNSASSSSVEKDEHETYLDNLRLLHFGVTVESTGEFFSEFPLLSDNSSWVEIDLQSYGWQD